MEKIHLITDEYVVWQYDALDLLVLTMLVIKQPLINLTIEKHLDSWTILKMTWTKMTNHGDMTKYLV